jgi:simple sugar transport system permease protein
MSVLSPVLALAITVVIGVVLFLLLGKDPLRGLQVFFVEPLKSGYALGELALKATPLLLIALGLAVCFRSNVWNIGAEASTSSARSAPAASRCRPTRRPALDRASRSSPPASLGGMAWAAIVALLRDKLRTRARSWSA